MKNLRFAPKTPPVHAVTAAVFSSKVICLLLLGAALLGSVRPATAANPGRQMVGDRLVLNGSFKTVAANAASSASSQAAISRATLTPGESASTRSFEVSLAMRDLPLLQAREAAGETITHARLEKDHLPAQADFDAVANWLTSQGFTITRRSGHRLALFARGTVAQIERAFQTKFAQVTFEGSTSLSIVSAPSVPASLPAVLGITGLQPSQRFHPFFHPPTRPAIDNAPPYLVSEILGAFDAASTTLTGAGEEIGIIIDALPLTDDLAQFYALNNSSQTVGNYDYEYTNETGFFDDPAGEETLDVSWSSAVAPQAHTHVFCTGSLYNVDTDTAYATIADELAAGEQPNLHQLSLSYGEDEDALASDDIDELNTESQYFATIASYGVTILVSSGDNGAFDGEGGLSVSYPASDPSVTAVGGVSVVLDQSSGAVDSITGWSADGVGFADGRIGASGGGISGVFSRPSWQTGATLPEGDMRCVPDVASSADQDEPGLLVFTSDGTQGIYGIGGTSWAAPTWAGLVALLNQGRANLGLSHLGLLNPSVYPLLGTNNFRDITTGSNGHNGENDGYSCQTGYDLVTGIGTPDFVNLAATLVPNALTITGFTPTSGPVGSTVTINGIGFTNVSVFFSDDVPASGSYTSTQIVVEVPAGARTGPITVSNGQSSVATASAFTVVAAKPVIGGATKATGQVGVAFSYGIVASNSPTSYGASPLPAGLSVNAGTGIIAGTPTAAGTSTVTLSATNAGGTGTGSLTLTISPAPLQPPEVTSEDAVATAGTAFTYQIKATENPTGYNATVLPVGLSVNPGTGLISGTPAFAGTYAIDLSATNAAGPGMGTLNLTVVAHTIKDFNGDGTSDLLWQNASTGERDVWTIKNGQPYQIVYFASIPSVWQIGGMGDFNGDGQTDIIWQNTQTGERDIWLMQGIALKGIVPLGIIPLEWQIAGVGDFNGDGKADILWQNTTTGERDIWLMNGTALQQVVYLATVPTVWQIAAVGDLDGDGISDILWQNTSTGERDIWYIDDAQVRAIALLATVPVEWEIAGVGDFDGDGHNDIVWQNTTTGERDLWFLTGAAVVESITELATVPPVWGIADH